MSIAWKSGSLNPLEHLGSVINLYKDSLISQKIINVKRVLILQFGAGNN
jgi:hypothetical protein